MNQAKPAGRDCHQKGNETEQKRTEQDMRGRVPKKKEDDDVDNSMEAIKGKHASTGLYRRRSERRVELSLIFHPFSAIP